MNRYNISLKPGRKLNNMLKKGGHFTMSAKHPQSKKELERLEPIIKDKLKMIGTSTKQMRQIANELGIDAGLVIKIKNQMMYTRSIADVEDIDITEPVEVVNIDNNLPIVDIEDQVKEEENKEEKSKGKKPRVYLTLEQELEICKHYVNKEFNTKELAELYNVSSSSISRVLLKHNSSRRGKNDMGKKKTVKKRKYNIPKNRDIEEVVAAAEEAKEVETIIEENRLYPEEGGIDPDANFLTIKFVTDLPIYSSHISSPNTIWAVSKNRDRNDIRSSICIQNKNKSDSKVINSLRGRYYLISISENIIHLIDYWDEVDNRFNIFVMKDKGGIKFRKEDGSIITYEELDEVIKSTIEYDRTLNRSRLRLNDFEFDNKNLSDLHKLFGFDKFSFNTIAKNNIETVEAGLVGDRHEVPVDKFIYPTTLSEDVMFNSNEMDRIARKFIEENFNLLSTNTKVLKAYLTGYQPALVSTIKACNDYGIKFIGMNYNASKKCYIPQGGNCELDEVGGYIKAFDKLYQQKNLAGDILLFNCTYEDFSESNIDNFYIMEAAKMRNTSSTDNQKEESVIIIMKNIEDIWKVYPTVLDHLLANDGLNLALWVTTAKIKENNLCWNMNIIKSFNYK